MVTIHILQYLIDNGIGTAIDQDMWFETLPLDKYGIVIVSVPNVKQRGRNTATQGFDIYCRDQFSNVSAVKKLEDIVYLLSGSYGESCTLPAVPQYSDNEYSRVVFDNITTIQNLGENQNGRVLYRIGATVTFNKESI